MISVDKAIQIVLKKVKTLPSKNVPLQNAQGLCLAENIKADSDMPPFNRAAMDGYAVIAKNTTKTPVDLVVVENIRAGYNPKKTIRSGEAAKIMTGSVVPKGADSVIKVEETRPCDGKTGVRLLKTIKKGGNIAKKGEDLRAGKIVLRKGAKIRPPEIGILATVGADTVQVFSVPSVGIISTGDELVSVAKKPKPWQIRNSNSYSLAAQVRRTIGDVEILGIASDQKSKIRSLVQKGLKKDILILSGGVSMGEFDLVGEVLKDLGITIFFEKVALRPGKPTVFGKIGEKVIFALPGNPVSTMVTFELFVRPCIKKMMGFTRYHNQILLAELEQSITMKKKRREYRPALLRYLENRWVVSPVDWHGSGDLFSTTKANSLLIIDEKVERFKVGDRVEVMLIDDFS
ncbi:MAG: molybdopterin molybdenumtransferase MoeA [Candidatus Scalindua sp. AMX11]|nr:MAG: molybdopterin molybdenumtransferase MoeA [Candidatus Scalindua sp.]NOG84511.1 molybdopterin molybdotransferase MoeA [Planctomycetota bacterium]RZV80481.1 MAG: molybdopterin molybdenumtransferase MoeA [Candidatus Scalindua sp. SCAELEC01]TDE65298.1 MAG: molybdopterin molybdenumtransferase MoeA [Candidatus Scalindua sp. AMX11]GJQ58511.1 MAG: molybdopterin molybdenumtransferase MoeA [Candidatus Scalindua sp.]